MDKAILKKIAADWCKSILLSNDSSFMVDDDILSEEECQYILEESKKIANRISKKPTLPSMMEIVGRYYEFEESE